MKISENNKCYFELLIWLAFILSVLAGVGIGILIITTPVEM